MLQIEAKVLPAFLVFVHIVEFDWNWNSEMVACQRHREVWLVYDQLLSGEDNDWLMRLTGHRDMLHLRDPYLW